jgi:hypothetical protein
MMATEEQINHLANRALENLYGGWFALVEGQLTQIIEMTGKMDDGALKAREQARVEVRRLRAKEIGAHKPDPC